MMMIMSKMMKMWRLKKKIYVTDLSSSRPRLNNVHITAIHTLGDLKVKHDD